MLNCEQVIPRGIRRIDEPSSSEHVDALQALRSVHLRKHLIDDTVGHTRAIVPSLRRDRVELVEEKDAGLCRLCSLKEFADLWLANVRRISLGGKVQGTH